MSLPFDPGAHPALTDAGARLKELAGDSAYKAGYDYYKKGLVKQGAVAGTTAYATVSGSTDYRVSVAFAAEPKVTCTCPAHRRSKYCKHVVAVLTALLEKPGSFAVTDPVPEEAVPKASGARKAAGPKAPRKSAEQEKAEARTAGLATLDTLLEELAAGGLVTLGEGKADLLGGAGEQVRALKLRRLGNLVLQLQRAAAASDRGLEPDRFAALLTDLYLTRAAAGAHLEGRVDMDPALAEDLLGKVWREGDLEPATGLELVELATTRESDGEFLIATGYLADLASGDIYTEKTITPARLAQGARVPYRHRLAVDEAGLYPGVAPRRIKLLKARREPLSSSDMARLLAHGLTSVLDLRRLLAERLAQPFGPAEVVVSFRPAALVTQGDLVGALDSQGRYLAVDLPGAQWKELSGILPAAGEYALFGVLTDTRGSSMRLRLLSAFSPGLRWSHGPIYPDPVSPGR